MAISRRTYTPGRLKNAEVLKDVAEVVPPVNVIEPGPLTLFHLTVNDPPRGNPSSVAVPCKGAAPGKFTRKLAPALTTGD